VHSQFVRRIAVYFDPMAGLWLMEDSGVIDSDVLDVDDTLPFAKQFGAAVDVAVELLFDRNVMIASTSRRGKDFVEFVADEFVIAGLMIDGEDEFDE
jgi:hypothetical protein